MADKILTEENFGEFVKNWRTNHDEMHAALEALIDSDQKVNEIYVRIYDNYYMTGTALRNYTNLPKHVVADLQNDISVSGIKLSDKKRRALVEYFRSVIYCGNYCALTRDEFSQLFGMLIVKFSSVVKKHEFAELSGLSANDIARILNGTKNLTAAEQKDILTYFHRLCYDALNNEMDEFSAVRELLETLLGKRLCPHSKRFYDIYFSFCDDADGEMVELALLSGIRLEDVQKIFNGDDLIYYPFSVHALFRIMLKRSEQNEILEKLDDADSWCYYRSLAEKPEYYNEFERERKSKEKAASNWFVTLPDMLKDIVYEFAVMQTVAATCRWLAAQKDNYMCEMSVSQEIHGRKDKLELILDIIELFRCLSDDKKNQLLEYLHSNIVIPLPVPISRQQKKENDRHTECAVFSFFLSSLVVNDTLSKKYQNAPINNTFEGTIYMKDRYRSALSMVFAGPPFLKEMLDFTAAEWQLAGYIEAAIVSNFPIAKIFDQLSEE